MDKKIEITRSYSQKVKIGDYLTADYFCSAKSEVAEEKAGEKSKELDELCRNEVRKSIEGYLNKPKVNREKLMEDGEKWQGNYNQQSAQEEIKVEESIAKE
ncbi:MAG TPA: hypothetical protein ENH85_00435 [Candidatus Scalindua sp.]|nr:hypothetical protein [Candidatus Scalindua sp.]